MKPGLVKRIAAILLMVTMLFGEALTVLSDNYTVVTTGAGDQVTFIYQYWCGDPATLNDNNKDNDPYKLYRDLTVSYDYSVQEGDEVLIDANADGLEGMPYDLTDIYVGTLQPGAEADSVLCSNADVEEDEEVSARVTRNTNKVIRLYYNPVVQEDYTNDVTMFDYDVMHNIKCAEGTNYSNATMLKKIVVEGGSTYSNTDSRYYYYLSWDGEELYIRQKNNSNTKIKVTYSTFTLTKSDGTVIRQVQKGDGKELVTMDAGINKNYYTTSTGTNHHTYYLAMGDYGRVHEVSLNINKSGVGTLDANNNNAWLGSGEYYGEDDGDRAIVPKLVSRLNGANNYYANLVMATVNYSQIKEPGYFSKTPAVGKTVYAGRFVANFKQVGNTYTLYSVKDGRTGSERFTINVPEGTTDYSLENIYKNNGQYNGIRTDFFPLDINGLGERNVDQATDKNNPNNCYFGMRYDFTFKIGDYIGPLEYTFAGDDDLWVFLDGKLVLDLGGMHSAYPTAAGYNDGDERDEDKNMVTSPTDPYSVNLWNEIITGSNKNPETANFDREKEHQITVLYMERGGFDSACYMNFTLPNARGMGYIGQVPANIELVKVDGTDTSKVLSGAEFKLTKYKDADTVDNYFGTDGSVTTTTGEDGKIKFSGITAGTYKLEETKAPDGYSKSNSTWTFIATEDENGNVIVDTSTVSNGQIANEPIPMPEPDPEIELKTEKTVEVVNWDDRTYKITLGASLLTQKVEHVEGSGDIVLALDDDTKQLMQDYATSSSCAYNTDQVDDMATILNAIGEDIISNQPVAGANVVDYIDSRFNVVTLDTNGNPTVLAEGAEITDKNGNKGTLKKDSNGLYVEWNDVTIGADENDAVGWSAEIFVQAKDEFIGGNYIPTNGPESGITVGDKPFPFPKPTTNVKLLAIDIEDKEIVLFKGEEIKPADYVAELNKTLKVIGINGESVEWGQAPQLTKEQISKLISGETIKIPYSYQGDEFGSFVYELASDYSWDNHVAEIIDPSVETYELHVYFDAKSIEEREVPDDGYTAPTNGTPEVDLTTPTEVGVYTVRVVSGQIDVTKKIKASDVDFKDGDPIFTFQIEKTDEKGNVQTQTRMVRFTKGMVLNLYPDSIEYISLQVSFRDLEKGTYTVKELSTMNYTLDSMSVDTNSTNCDYDKTIKFAIGQVSLTDSTTNLAATKGAAIFINKTTTLSGESDKDMAVNTVTIDVNGNVVITKKVIPDQQ